MRIPVNTFKQRLLAGERQIGLWLGLAHPYAAELAANAGFDWLLIDGEHAPNDVGSVLAQLQALAPYCGQPIVRPPAGDTVLIKRLLDIGAQTLLIPMVENAAQAQQLVRAMRYPPAGVRGVGNSITRAARWDCVEDYLDSADAQMCLLAQIESPQGLDNLDDICAVDGVDGVFIGPVDLSAALGHRGNPGHPEVQAAIERAIDTIARHGKACGIWCGDEARAQHFLDLGVRFIAVGADTHVLLDAARALRARFRTH